jgi:flagellar basal body P-ring formation protein FlgA
MLNSVGLIVRGAAAALLVLAFAHAATAEERRLPVPSVTIRPGEVIKDEMITERAAHSSRSGIPTPA